MRSKWYESKPFAKELRKKGFSIRDIENILSIPRSTLSGWFKDIQLTSKQKNRLEIRWKKGLVRARKGAIIWHNRQKQERLTLAKEQALTVLSEIDSTNKPILELALSMLYLGEGDKTKITSMGSSNPLILKFFIKSLDTLFGVSSSDIRCELHLRSDQNIKNIIQYWSRQLDISPDKFKAYKDKRTVKSKTYPAYKGVCVVRCGKIAIQRRLVYIGEEFCKIITTGSVSSAG